jgi:hypothetical protein
MDASEMPTIFNRRLSFPVRFPGAPFDLGINNPLFYLLFEAQASQNSQSSGRIAT